VACAVDQPRNRAGNFPPPPLSLSTSPQRKTAEAAAPRRKAPDTGGVRDESQDDHLPDPDAAGAGPRPGRAPEGWQAAPEDPAIQALAAARRAPTGDQPTDISLEVHIDAGLPIVNFEVPTHETQAYETDDGLIHVNLADHDSIPNRDFVLRYRVDGEQLQAALLAHRGERGGFFSLIVQPPTLDLEKVVGKRELVFVVDVSGSMFGMPLAMCKTAMRMAIQQLRPSDTFNVLTFAGQTARAFERSRPTSRENINAALKFTAEAEAGGGTYMADAVKAALTPAIERGRHRYVFFLTDGYVGNESQIFSLARQFAKKHTRRGQKARVFGFGVGSSVNRHLIDGLSKAGRGRAVYAGPRESPRLAGKKRKTSVPRVVAGAIRISGSLDKSIIQRVIRRHRKEIRYCYEKELQKNPKLAGKIVVPFVVHATGLVAIAKIIESTMKNEKVERCIAHEVRRWKFPKITGGGQAVVNYPFVFKSAP